MKEVKDGRCESFYKGILLLSWKEIDHRRMNGFPVNEKGKSLHNRVGKVVLSYWHNIQWNELNNT